MSAREAKASDGKSCPYCGSTDGYDVGIRVNGWAIYNGYWNGDEEIGSEDGLRYSRPKTVKCLSCSRRVAYPKRRGAQ